MAIHNAVNTYETNRTMSQFNLSTKNPFAKTKVNNDIDINYFKVGNGPQVLLMCPGVLGDIDDYKLLMENLDREKYTMVAWNPPGFAYMLSGENISPDFVHKRDADCAISLMEALQINKYSLLAWCNGGCTALFVAIKAAGRVERIVLWSSYASVSAKDIDNQKVMLDIQNFPQNMRISLVEKYGEKNVVGAWKVWLDSLKTTLEKNDGGICKQILPEINIPTLIMHGAKDTIVLVDHAVYLHNNIKNSSLKIFPDGRHAIHFMFTQQFIDTVDNFFTIKQ